ncbi:MAG: hypothetical protein C4348_00105 [Patescibacteria group bacterium]
MKTFSIFLLVLLLLSPFYLSLSQSEVPNPINFQIPLFRFCEPGDTVGQCFARLATIFLRFVIVAGMVWVAYHLASAGFSFATHGGDPEKIKKIKNKLIYAAVGAVVVLLSWAIILFLEGVIRRGQF